MHSVQYSSVHRLEPVPYVRKRTPDYDGHGILQEQGAVQGQSPESSLCTWSVEQPDKV